MPELQSCITFGHYARCIVCQKYQVIVEEAGQPGRYRRREGAKIMDLGLKGKTVLVTGASQGIGEGVARGFAAEGCHLHLVARSEDRLKALKSELEKSSG